MGHRIIIGNEHEKTYSDPPTQPKAVVTIEYEPDDADSVNEQAAQYKQLLRLYLKALHVADPDHHADPGE